MLFCPPKRRCHKKPGRRPGWLRLILFVVKHPIAALAQGRNKSAETCRDALGIAIPVGL
jgi:hypothetical protein